MEHALIEIDALSVAATKNLHSLGPFHCLSWASQVGVQTSSISVTWESERVHIPRLLQIPGIRSSPVFLLNKPSR